MGRVWSHNLPCHHVGVVEARFGEPGEHDRGVGVVQPHAQVASFVRLWAGPSEALRLVRWWPDQGHPARVHAKQLSKVFLVDVAVMHDPHCGAAPHITLMAVCGSVVQPYDGWESVNDTAPLGVLMTPEDPTSAHFWKQGVLKAWGMPAPL
eukprot:CAMPEP_0117684324 /NCGR_PEP_ID=MMETSP0804-20121206/21013_1 /TAXON_ID=1074897 /ORGANISM="Tetraselmis astigmatica, Strain CCMP880" /LENGTH=150 /DNA_ID=CAMNT_0005495257 /DNA_START=291 /DNA_END=744 /DNA_ORIENTATION=+